MSMPTYVESQSGNWYKDPTIRGSGWYVCWDDTDPIELVCKQKGPAPQNVIDQLRSLGWDVKFKSRGIVRSRKFGKKFHSANSIFLVQQNGPPDELIRKSNEAIAWSRAGEGTYYMNSRNGNGNGGVKY